MGRATAGVLRGVRTAVVLVFGWAFSTFWIPLVVLAAVLSRGEDRVVRPLVRAWGKVLLALAGVRVEVEPEDELRRRRRRVVCFNHASTLDMLVVTSIYPPGATGIIKREFLRIPVFGLAARYLDFVAIDRADRESAAAALREASARVREKDLTVIIAPEGTRSRTGELGPFKLGAFHIALDAGAPIVPVVLYGPSVLWPYGRLACSPGRVVVRVLPEVPCDALEPDRLHEAAGALRDRVAGEIAEMAVRYGDPRRSGPPVTNHRP